MKIFQKKVEVTRPPLLRTHYGWYVRWWNPLDQRWTAHNRWFLDFARARALARRKAATLGRSEYVEVVRFKTEETEDWDA